MSGRMCQLNVCRYLVGVNPIALRKAKIVCNFGISECNRVKYNCQRCSATLVISGQRLLVLFGSKTDLAISGRKKCFSVARQC